MIERHARAGFALACAALLAACSRPANPIVVYAAASLTAPFTAIGEEFAKTAPEYALQFVFEGSPNLVLKLQQGGAADVIATADQPNMDKVVAQKLTTAAPVEFAQNRLAIIVAPGNPEHVAQLADLARPDLLVALCGETVPAGRYARQALAKAGVTLTPLSDETSVAALCSKVRLGELDAGIAYVTDAKAQQLDAVELRWEHDVIASYPIAVLTAGKQRKGGERFVDFVCSMAGRRILVEHGFR